MGIKLNPKTKLYDIQVSARHPKTKKPRSLKRIGFQTMAEAKRAEKKMEAELWQKFHDDVAPRWSEFLKEYEEHVNRMDLSAKTKEGRIQDVKRYTLQAWKRINLDKISENMVNQILLSDDYLKNKPSRQKDVLKHIRHAFNYACEKEYLTRNPTPNKKFKIGRKLMPVLNEKEVKILLSEAKKENHPWYYIWSVGFYTGMRSGELYALKWNDIKFETKDIIINSGWTKKGGFSETKSGNDRIVEISKSLMPILEELKEITGNNKYVLPRLKQWTMGSQAAILRAFLNKCNLPSVRFHDIRATWATILLSKGVPYPVVMRMGGWEETKTMDRYLRKSGVNIRGSTNVLEF